LRLGKRHTLEALAMNPCNTRPQLRRGGRWQSSTNHVGLLRRAFRKLDASAHAADFVFWPSLSRSSPLTQPCWTGSLVDHSPPDRVKETPASRTSTTHVGIEIGRAPGHDTLQLACFKSDPKRYIVTPEIAKDRKLDNSGWPPRVGSNTLRRGWSASD